MCVDALRTLKQALQFQDFNIQIWYRGHTESKIMQSQQEWEDQGSIIQISHLTVQYLKLLSNTLKLYMHFYDGGIIAPSKGSNQDANQDLNPTFNITLIASQVSLEPVCTSQADTFCPCHIAPPNLGEIDIKAQIAKTEDSHS